MQSSIQIPDGHLVKTKAFSGFQFGGILFLRKGSLMVQTPGGVGERSRLFYVPMSFLFGGMLGDIFSFILR